MRTTIGACLIEARRELASAGIESADLDARLLVADALGVDAASLVLRTHDEIDTPATQAVAAWVRRRLSGEPVHRILGRRAFYAHDFRLSPATLEPRPDTEALVDLCREPMAGTIRRTGACRFADIGTGTGAIAVSLLALFPEAVGLAVDISAEALATARENACAAGVEARFEPVLSDYLEGVAGPLDLVVSNPPYIPSFEIETLSREVREHDPRLALDGGPDGLDAYRALASGCARVLTQDGFVLVEIGRGQREDVERLFEGHGLVIAASAHDLGGVERALSFRRG